MTLAIEYNSRNGLTIRFDPPTPRIGKLLFPYVIMLLCEYVIHFSIAEGKSASYADPFVNQRCNWTQNKPLQQKSKISHLSKKTPTLNLWEYKSLPFTLLVGGARWTHLMIQSVSPVMKGITRMPCHYFPYRLQQTERRDIGATYKPPINAKNDEIPKGFCLL